MALLEATTKTTGSTFLRGDQEFERNTLLVLLPGGDGEWVILPWGE
jgi:hypothetical protein